MAGLWGKLRRGAALGAMAVAVGLAGRASAAGGTAVALVEAEGGDTSFVTDVQQKLQATGRFSSVDIIDANSTTPTVAQLSAYRSVLVWSDFGFANSTTLGNNLDTYARQGGGVVVAVFATDEAPLGGSFASNGDYPVVVGANKEGEDDTLGTVHQPSSPLMAGVNSFDGGASSYHDTGALTSGAIDIADWSDGRPLVATKAVNGFNVVELNFFPSSSDARADFWKSSTDGTALMANALQFAGTVQTGVAVPTLSEWALGALTVLLGGFGLAALRRRPASRRPA